MMFTFHQSPAGHRRLRSAIQQHAQFPKTKVRVTVPRITPALWACLLALTFLISSARSQQGESAKAAKQTGSALGSSASASAAQLVSSPLLPRERAAALLQQAMAIAPGDGQAFLELGEDIADEAAAHDAIELRALAVQLLVTAHEHARVQDGGQARSVRVSALLALTETLPTRSDRERVRALAALLDPSGAGLLLRGQELSQVGQGPQAQQAVDYLVALVLGSVRSGDGTRARQLLRRSDVRERLQSLEGLLSRAGIAGGMSRVLEEAAKWPCPVCGGTKTEKPTRAGGEARLCTHCQGVPGPKLSAQETLAWLRVESQLLHLDHTSWAAQRALDGGEPIAIIDDENLPRWIGVQPLLPPPAAVTPSATNPVNQSPTTPAAGDDAPPPPAGG